MRPAVRKGILRGTGIALVLIFLATDASAVAAENAPPSIHGETEYLILLDPLAQTRREEETLLGTMRETAKAASQPHAEYLLYQGSLHFAEQDARLAQLKMEKRKILERLALLQEATGRSTRLLYGWADDSAGRGSPPYSGAPLLSFYDATRPAPGALPYSSFGIALFRFFFIPALTLAFFLPVMAIEKGTVRLRRKGRKWIASHYTRMKRGLRGDPPGEIVRRGMGRGPHGKTPKTA